MGPEGRREAGAERTGMGKQERKRENRLREKKTQCRWTRSRATVSRSCRDASIHPFLVLPCTDTSCITTSQALAGPAKRSGMEGWRSVPGLHLLEKEARGGWWWRQWCRKERGGSHGLRDSNRERGLLHIAPHPCPSTSSSEAIRDLRDWSMVRSSSSNCLTRLGWKMGTPGGGQQRTGSRM